MWLSIRIRFSLSSWLAACRWYMSLFPYSANRNLLMYPFLDPLTITDLGQWVLHESWYFPLCITRGGRVNPAALTYVNIVVRFGFSWGCFWNCFIPFRPMTFFTFGISSDPCLSMFQIYFRSVISSWFSTSWYFLYYFKTKLFWVAFAHAIDKFVTVSFTFNCGYHLRRKPDHFPPVLLCILLKPSNPLAAAKSNAFFWTSLPDRGNSRKKISPIILTISSGSKELTSYSGEGVGNNMYLIQFNKPKQSLVQWFSLPACVLGMILLFPLPSEQCS